MRQGVRHATRALPFPLALLLLLLQGACQSADDPSLLRRRVTDSVTGMQLILVPAGEFMMGTPDEEPLREEQERLHRVTITRPFYMGRHEVTQGEWEAVMGENPSRFRECGPSCPVENVSFIRIQEFIGRLNDRSGERYRLPTEAEWEYACRAGTTSAYGTGESLTAEEANIEEPGPLGPATGAAGGGRTVPVGTYEPNPWGFYDMHGNVWEWVQDRHCPYPDGPVTDPLGACDSGRRVIRGGSWHFGADSARCGLRYTHQEADSGPSLGFRLVREIP